MYTFLLIIMVLVFGVVFLGGKDLFFGMRSMTKIGSVPLFEGKDPPLVSVIIPVCNEGAGIKNSVLSLLSQTYDRLEIIVVNDRSTDHTSDVLKELQSKYTQLQVVEVKRLPAGWMGKQHAMHCGALLAKGDVFVFTDGDVCMENTTISRTVFYLQNQHLDHLCLIFKNISSGWLLNSLILDAGVGLMQIFKPWLAKTRRNRFIGVGAFNMIRSDVYQDISGHETIKMHPIDDIMLGKRVKQGSYSQECLLGQEFVLVPWYRSVNEMIDGLMKNVLGIINYRFCLILPALAIMVVVSIFPFWGALLLHGPLQWICGGIVVIKIVIAMAGSRFLGLSLWCSMGTLITPYILAYIVLRAALLNWKDDGIIWRGTHYSLKDLRKNEWLLSGF